jgi:MFS family permease
MATPSQPAARPQLPGRAPDSGADRRRAWLITVLIVAFMVMNYADKSVLGLAAVPIMKELGISNGTYGLVSSSFFLLFSLSGLVVGFFSARISSRVLLFGMAALWAVAQLPVLFAATVPALVAGRMLLGVAEGPAAPMSMHALYTWFPEKRRGLPSALQISGAALGTLIAAPVVTWLIAVFGWRSAFAALAVASAVWGALWWRAGQDGPYGHDHHTAHGAGAVAGQAVRLPYRRILATGTALGSIAGAFGASWALALSQAWLPAYLRTQLGMTSGGAAALISGVSALSFVLLLGVSPLVDALNRRGVSARWSRGAPQGIAVTLAGLAMAVLPFVHVRAPLVALIAVAFGVHAIAFPLHYMTAAAVTPPGQRGAVFGIVAAIGTLPGLIAPYLTGRLLDAAVSRDTGYANAFLLSGAVMLAAGLLALVAIRPERDAQRLGLPAMTDESAAASGAVEPRVGQVDGSKPLAQ